MNSQENGPSYLNEPVYEQGPNIQPRAQEQSGKKATPENVMDSLFNPSNQVANYRAPQNTVAVPYQKGSVQINIHHNPQTDSAMASNIMLKTHFAKFVGLLIFIVLVSCIAVIAIDSKNEYENMVVDETIKIENCLKTYEENRCHPHQRVPALNDFCLELELCLNSDPRKVAKRSAAFSFLVAENANKLFGNLKLQTVLVICVLLFGSIISCNLFLARDRVGTTAQVQVKNKRDN